MYNCIMISMAISNPTPYTTLLWNSTLEAISNGHIMQSSDKHCLKEQELWWGGPFLLAKTH
jgi:hypothetical protein